jgi:cation diffusion facilitator family transporter
VSSEPFLGPLSRAASGAGSASLTTVLVAFAANLLVAVAKSVAAVVTGSASILAEAAHSWADTGNEVFLVIANRRSRRPPDRMHPFGHGREAYVWSLLAALGLFVAGAAASVTHGVQELLHPAPASDYVVGYVVLAVSFVLEGISFLRSVRQARPTAELMERDLIGAVMATSDPTLRAVFAEDFAALIGLAIAAVALGADQLTGSSTPDAVGSILVGLLLAAVATVLIDRNREFLIGQEADPRVREAAIRALLAQPEVARVTYLRLEFVGPRLVSVIGDVDLTGDDTESDVTARLRALEAKIDASRRWPAPSSASLRPTSRRSPDRPKTERARAAMVPPAAEIRRKPQRVRSATDAASGHACDHRPINGRSHPMHKRRINTLRSAVETGLQAVALVSLVRRIGPRRIGRIALATEAYVANSRRGRRRRTAER